MTAVSEAMSDIIRERNELRAEVRRLRAALDLAVLQRKQWEAWTMGAEQAAQELRTKKARNAA